eukprot:362489-Chlamydomonas_euryale.AAC.3
MLRRSKCTLLRSKPRGDPDASAPPPPFPAVPPPPLCRQAHDKEVVAVMLACVGEDSDNLRRSLLTVGIDNKLMAWDASSLQETNKYKLDAKDTMNGVGRGQPSGDQQG